MAYDQLIHLWPDGCPHNDAPDAEMIAGRPVMRRYSPAQRRAPEKPRPAMVICPGGGYARRACHEGDAVAHLLCAHGIECFVVDYRVAPCRFPAAYADASRAVRLVRSHAAEFNIDPARIGLMGFSAGGHLAASVATQPDLHQDPHDDLAGKISARPDRSILGYPVISGVIAARHAGSFRNLLGIENLDDPAQAGALRQQSHELHVTPATPSTFIFHCFQDAAVPPQHALGYAQACADKGVSCELHLYAGGAHGIGMALTDPRLKEWTALLLSWLGDWVSPLN